MDELWMLAEAQHAAFARYQSTELGVPWRWLDRRVRGGDLDAVTPRVLRAAGAPRTAEQELTIRILDAGPGAQACKRSAAWLWGLPGVGPGQLDIARGRGRWARSGATSRWPRLLPEHHLTVVRGIPVTTLARTIFDLAGLPPYSRRIGGIIDNVYGKSPSILVALHRMLPELAERGRNGITVMRTELAKRPPGTVPLTGMERRFEAILGEGGIAVPRRQVDLGGHSWIGRVDYYDDDIAVIYEIDSLLHHTSLTDRRNDELRDAAARAAGFKEVVRIPEEDVWYAPHLVRKAVLDTRRT